MAEQEVWKRKRTARLSLFLANHWSSLLLMAIFLAAGIVAAWRLAHSKGARKGVALST